MLNKYSLKAPLCLLVCFLINTCCVAAPRYWVGPLNGKWSDATNWSATNDGAGGAGVPTESDDVLFINSNAKPVIDVDVSTTINSFQINHAGAVSITLYAVSNVTLTIKSRFYIDYTTAIIDSTFGDVSFNVKLLGSSNATGEILGRWIFRGGSPVTGSNGPGFTTEEGSRLLFRGFPISSFQTPASLILEDNHGAFVSSYSTLQFEALTTLRLIDNVNAVIPAANWDDSSNITISGSMSRLTHLGSATYGTVNVDLQNLPADAGLDLPNGAFLNMLNITNTNDHTLTILNNKGPVSATIAGSTLSTLNISGGATKVALSRADQLSSAADFQLTTRLYRQSGGNFSLQDADEYTGSSILSINFNAYQTGGTFITNSKAQNPSAKFVLEMNSFPLRLTTDWDLSMSSGTIDNGRNMVTLRMAASSQDIRVNLTKPLKVGKLDLRLGRIITTDQNLLTVTNPDSSAVSVAASPAITFIAGPLARATNSVSAYQFPTGNFSGGLRSCWITPTSAINSTYQASNISTAYSQLGTTYPLKGISNKEYWNITKVNGADAKVRLQLNAPVSGASASDALVVAHFVNNSWISERGTTIQPGTANSGQATSKSLNDFGAFTFGYEDPKKDEVITSSCPNDTIFVSPACKAKVAWNAPNIAFPETLNANNQSNISKLMFKGCLDGHGYYESTDKYNWRDANDAVNQLNGHLVTVNSAAENTFINTNINERENYAWIGLRNTGKQGGFAWVTGEPLDFTNWLPGQPDNLYGMNNADTTIFEPYVHINGFDSLNRWNDNSAGTVARIIAEFDHPLFTHRQISGPINGDSLSSGTYTVCYEKTNTATGIIDTCCFNITVICQPANSANEPLQQANTVQVSQNVFSAKVITNPSTTSFTIKINGDNFKDRVMVEVTDASGRIVDRKSNIMIGNTFQLGSGYTTGIYFARVSQGVKMMVLKLVKK